MWPFKKDTADISSKARTAAMVLFEGSNASVQFFLKGLFGNADPIKHKKIIDPISLEILAFGIHLTDRIAFQKLGEARRAKFMDELLSTILSDINPKVTEQFERLVNLRHTFYGSFQKLVPGEGENLKGTLFWEFAKLFSSTFYGKNNLVVIHETAGYGMSYYAGTVKALKEYKIFS